MGGGEVSPEFQDWEVLVHSDTEAPAAVISSPVWTENPRSFEEIEADSGGMIRLDHFSIGNDSMFDKSVVEVDSSVESDNPSWIDPAAVDNNGFEGKNSVGFWSDDRKVGEFDVGNELGAEKLEEIEANKEEEFDQLEGKKKKSESDFDVKSCGLGFEETEEKLAKERGDDGGLVVLGSELNAPPVVEEENSGGGGKPVGGDEGRRKPEPVVWWKVPLELLKCCVFRVSPVWTFSMAAAVMGFVILGRKLYKMKRKARSLELKVTVDDKKVSQFMSRAARLNEAFLVVRRVPIVRPMLPATTGVTPWPVMSMR